MSTYHFQPGERVRVISEYEGTILRSPGAVIAFLPASGLPDAQGVRADRVRVKLDHWPRQRFFLARHVEPIADNKGN